MSSEKNKTMNLTVETENLTVKECCCCVSEHADITEGHWRCTPEQLQNMIQSIDNQLSKYDKASWGGGIICRHMRNILEKQYICDCSYGSYILLTGKKETD